MPDTSERKVTSFSSRIPMSILSSLRQKCGARHPVPSTELSEDVDIALQEVYEIVRDICVDPRGKGVRDCCILEREELDDDFYRKTVVFALTKYASSGYRRRRSTFVVFRF